MKFEMMLASEKTLMSCNEEGDKFLRKSKVGKAFNVEVKEIRNYDFHKKVITLFMLVHDLIDEPNEIEFRGKIIRPEHTLENTRKYMTVKAGHYYVNAYPDGSIRVEARSISFSNMSQNQFEKLFNDLINVALKIIPESWTEEKIQKTVNDIIRYDN